MLDINITAETREITTKGAVNQLRRDGKVPGVLYSKEMEPVNFSVHELSLKPVVFTTEMHLVNIKIGENEEVKSILKDVQFDALTDKITHIDFQAITVGQVIQVQIPFNLVGQSVGIKSGGTLQQTLNKLDIECLPKHIPENIELEITNLNIGDSIRVGDLSYENITILNSTDSTIVSVVAPRAEEEEETTEEVLDDTDEAAQPEVIGKEKAEEESE